MKILVLFFILASSLTVWCLPKQSRIIGGSPAIVGQFPYVAAIYKTTLDGRYFCVGSILNHRWIITAGQCVDGAISFTILLGTHTLSGDVESMQEFSTSSYVLHPDYNAKTLENDIGLIELRMDITFTTYIRRLNLHPVDLQGSIVGVGVGWGQTSDSDSNLSDTLNYVTLASVSDAECRITYGGQLGKNMLCFEGSNNQGTCFGDSGSPLVQDLSRGYTVLVAISTFFSANGCESTDPSGYTKIYPYNDWIGNVTKSS